MRIEILLKEGKTEIILKNKRKIIDRLDFDGKNNLSEVILSGIDGILRKNKIPKKELKNISIRSQLPNSYTSSRIAESIARSFDFSRKLVSVR